MTLLNGRPKCIRVISSTSGRVYTFISFLIGEQMQVSKNKDHYECYTRNINEY